MKQYYLNALQYHTLPVLLGEKQNRMAACIGVSTFKFSRHIQDGDFRINEAIRLCNKYRLNLSYFITTDEDAPFGGIRQTDEDEWRDITWSSRDIMRLLNTGVLTYAEIMDKTGFARSTIDTVIEGRCLTSQLLKFCNDMQCNIGGFISDRTLPTIVDGIDIKKQNIMLRSENAQLRKQVADLKRQVRELQERCNGMLMVAE